MPGPEEPRPSPPGLYWAAQARPLRRIDFCTPPAEGVDLWLRGLEPA